MRSLVLVVAAAFIAATSHAFIAFDPLEAIHLHATPKSLMHTAFGALQSSVNTSNPECAEQLAALVNLSTKCTAAVSAASNVQLWNQTSVHAAETACASRCMTEVIAFYKTPISEKCFGGTVFYYGSLYEAYCAKSKVNDELCAVTLQRTSPDCSRLAVESDCVKMDACQWNTTTLACLRNAMPPKGLLDAYCGSGCVEKQVEIYKKIDPAAATTTRNGLDAVCLKNSGNYCLPIWNELSSKLSLTVDVKDRPTFCNNASAFGCLRAYVSFAASSVIHGADSTFKSCIGSSKTPSDATKKSCVQSYLAVVQTIDKFVLLVDVMCATTNGTANGTPCLPLYGNISRETSVAACSKNLDKGECSDACDTIFVERMRELGCCGYYVLQVSARPLPDDKRLPATTGGASVSFKDANTTTVEPSDIFKACPKTKADATLFARCTVAEGKRQKKSLKVNVAYAEIAKDVALFARVKLALRKDMAASLGIFEDAIVSDDVTEDTSRQITVKVASSSRQQTTSTEQKKNAAKYDFSIAGQDEASTNAAAAKFDSQSSAGTLQTTSTSNAVSACTSCTDASGSIASGPPSTVASSLAVARAAAAVIIAVVAVIATW